MNKFDLVVVNINTMTLIAAVLVLSKAAWQRACLGARAWHANAAQRTTPRQRNRIHIHDHLSCALLLAGAVSALAQASTAGKGAAGPAMPHGLDVYRQIETLPRLAPLFWAQGFSSYQRDGGNYDRGFFLYRDGPEYVMSDLQGPGTVYRLWTTGHAGGNHLRFYLDGATSPQIDRTFNNYFAGVNSPFLSPLNDNDAKSSGGYYSYLPVTFSNACRITTTDANLYYNITLMRAPTATSLVTWTGSEDSSDVRAQWNSAGAPVGTYTNTVAITNSFHLFPGKAVVLADVAAARVIHSIRIKNPNFVYDAGIGDPVTDDGRAYTGYGQFIMRITNVNDGVRLVRRMDYGISNQKGNVYVDAAYVGQWYDPGGYGGFYDSPFDIPKFFTDGKNAITVKVEFVSSAIDWNEFTYWAYSLQGTNEILTDELDVGTGAAALASEAAHSYTNTQESWTGTRTFYYVDFSPVNESHLLTGVWINATWDGAHVEAVRAPLGCFFGMPFGVREVRALMFGLNTNDNECYSYFPMPFEHSGLLIITNTGSRTVSNLWCEVRHSALTDSMDDLGYFHATFREARPTAGDGRDYIFLETNGCGHLVGVVHAMKSDSVRWYLEGDERFYIDGNRTPRVYGTGTEDYYNGGWYFSRGIFNLPCHGNPNHKTPVGGDWTACYRVHLADRIPFRASIRAGIEHGGNNDVTVDYSSVAFWYARQTPAMVLVDTLDVGNAASESAHQYTNAGQVAEQALTSSYEGDDSNVMITDTGRVHAGFCQFRVAASPGRDALMLRRRSDFSLTNQMVNVEVNGHPAGVWLCAGYNPCSTRWVDDEFVIPDWCLGDGMHADIRLTTTNGALWSEYRYEVFAVYDPVIPEPLVGACAIAMLGAICSRGR